MKSLISNAKQCLVCGTTYNLHKHHIYGGNGRRDKSEKYGCWVYLCFRHHNGAGVGVHFNKALDLRLKQDCQKEWENQFGSRDDFIKTFGRSYL